MFNFKEQMDIIVEKENVVDVLDIIGESTGNIDYNVAQYRALPSKYYYIGYKATSNEQDAIMKSLLAYGGIEFQTDKSGDLVKVFKRAE